MRFAPSCGIGFSSQFPEEPARRIYLPQLEKTDSPAPFADAAPGERIKLRLAKYSDVNLTGPVRRATPADENGGGPAVPR